MSIKYLGRLGYNGAGGYTPVPWVLGLWMPAGPGRSARVGGFLMLILPTECTGYNPKVARKIKTAFAYYEANDVKGFFLWKKRRYPTTQSKTSLRTVECPPERSIPISGSR